MPSSAFHRRLTFISAVVFLLCTSEAVGLHRHPWMPIDSNKLGLTCKRNVGGKCIGDEPYLSTHLDIRVSELKRRMLALATTQYISYAALTANSVPCSISGASYYNCQPGAEANPYDRSCTAATQCRS